MLPDKITTVLFDLDGTLLPMDERLFVKSYFGELAKKGAEHGCTDSEKLVSAVWKGTAAMVKNDGKEKNDARFWQVFTSEMNELESRLRPVFDRFYAEEFHRVRKVVGENPLAKQAVQGLKARGMDVILATNPLFPKVAINTRLSWLGLETGDFLEVTSYEDYSFCKPNPRYYREILQKTGKCPEECLMVGNDAEEDLAAQELGISVFLVTDCLINEKNRDISGVPQGNFEEFMGFAGLC